MFVVMLPVKTLVPVLAKKAVVVAVAWGMDEMRKAINKKMESGEARDPIEAARLVAKGWTQWLKNGFNQGPAAEGV